MILMHLKFINHHFIIKGEPSCEAEKIHGLKATKRTEILLSNNDFIIESSKVPGIYGRYGAKITFKDGRSFSDIMIAEGLQKREDYSNE